MRIDKKQFALRACSSLFVMALGAGLCSGCSGAPVQSGNEIVLLEPVEVTVDTDVAAIRDIVNQETAKATVVPISVDLMFEKNGDFGKYEVKEGQHVNAGDILATLDTESYEKQIKELREALEKQMNNDALDNQIDQINIQIKNESVLEADKLEETTEEQKQIARYELAKMATQYRQKTENQQRDYAYQQQEIDKLQEIVDHATIVAPCDGTILALLTKKKGEGIDQETPVISFSKDEDLDKLRLRTDFVNGSYVKECQDVYGKSNDERLEVEYIPYSVDEMTAFTIEQRTGYPAFFAISPEDCLNRTIGEYIQMVYVKEAEYDVLAVASGAIFKDGNTNYVYVMDENGDRVRKDVTIGLKNALYTQILTGIEEGDVVYVQN